MAANADPPDRGNTNPPDRGDPDPCTDRLSAGESCGATATAAGPTDRPDRTSGPTDDRHGLAPATLYQVRIAVLEARVESLESELEARESDLQHVVDRYERVLQERDACRDEPLVASEFDRTELAGGESTRERDRNRRAGTTGALDRLRGLLE